MLITIDGKVATRYVHFFRSNPSFLHHLQTWGEAGTIKIKNKGTPKIVDRGLQCGMFAGYATNRTGDTYRMWDPDTSRVHETRDIIWLKRMFFFKPTIPHDFAIVNEENDIDIVIPQHKAGESTTPDGESTDPDDADVPPDDSLGERESGKDDDDSSSASSEGTNAQDRATTSTRSGRIINKPA